MGVAVLLCCLLKNQVSKFWSSRNALWNAFFINVLHFRRMVCYCFLCFSQSADGISMSVCWSVDSLTAGQSLRRTWMKRINAKLQVHLFEVANDRTKFAGPDIKKINMRRATFVIWGQNMNFKFVFMLLLFSWSIYIKHLKRRLEDQPNSPVTLLWSLMQLPLVQNTKKWTTIHFLW